MDFVMDRIVPVFIVAIIIVALVMIALLPAGYYADRVCLKAGFPHSYVTWKFEMFCGKIVNQTEYVCPIKNGAVGECVTR